MIDLNGYIDKHQTPKREKAIIAALLAAWQPFIASTLAGRTPNWEEFRKVSERAIGDRVEAAKRLAFVLLLLEWIGGALAFFAIGRGMMFRNAKDFARSEMSRWESDGRISELGRELVKTSQKRWGDLPKNPTQDDLERFVNRNFGHDRAELIAATEFTAALVRGQGLAVKLLRKAGINLVGYWIAEPDACQECAQCAGKADSFWRQIFPEGPPSPHAGCRCRIRWVREDVKT